MSSQTSPPTLYVFVGSIWTKVPELALLELGYPAGAVEKKSVNLVAAENLSPAFVAISKDATLPVLTVGGESYTSTKAVTAYLVAHAPHPAAPGAHAALIDQLHADAIDPNFPFLGARSAAELAGKRGAFPGLFVRSRYSAVVAFEKDADAAMKAFYATKLPTLAYLNSVYADDAPAPLVDGWVQHSVQHMQRVDAFIRGALPAALPESGFVEGAQPGEADFHIAAWLARIALLSGASTGPEGSAALARELGEPLPEKVARYWEAWTERESFKTVYADGLH